MTEINKISASQTADVKNTNNNNGIKPNDNGLKQDTVNISPMSKKKKVGIAVAAMSLIGSAVSLAVMIGRNPAKAAKVLKGNSKIANEAYTEGNRLAEEILSKKGEFSTALNDVLSIFKKPEYKTELHKEIANVETYFAEHNITPDKETEKALKTIKQNLEEHCNNVQQELLRGNEIKEFERNEAFATKNTRDFNTVNTFLMNQKEANYEIRSAFHPSRISYKLHLEENIHTCPREVLPNDGIFYHGTQKPSTVYKNGFTNFASKQLENSPRELGAGVYVTPDVGVAAYFSGLEGSIIPVKLVPESNIALVTENCYQKFTNNVSRFIQERMPKEEFEKLPNDVQNAMRECITQKIFQQAGYDAAYIPKGVKGGGGILGNIFGGNINEAIGKKQSQVVVFKAENLEITSRGFKDRICDLKDKFKALKAQIKYQMEHPYGI